MTAPTFRYPVASVPDGAEPYVEILWRDGYHRAVDALIDATISGRLPSEDAGAIEHYLDEEARLGRFRAAVRIRVPYDDRIARYLPPHRLVANGPAGCLVVLDAVAARWTVDRLASGLIGAEIEGDG